MGWNAVHTTCAVIFFTLYDSIMCMRALRSRDHRGGLLALGASAATACRVYQCGNESCKAAQFEANRAPFDDVSSARVEGTESVRLVQERAESVATRKM